MAVTPIRLYSRWQNSAGERVRIALNLKKIAYEYIAVGSLPDGHYKKLNPQRLIPALSVGGQIISQSAAILEYLEEAYTEHPLLPADLILRAQCRAFAQHITSDLHPLNNNRVRKYLAGELHVTEAGIGEWYRHWVGITLTALEQTLADRPADWPFCFGAEPGWADVHLVPQIANARRFDCDLSAFPTICQIDARCSPLDACRLARSEAQSDYPGEPLK